MQNNSPTEAGHSNTAQTDQKLALVDAINQVFTLFRLNYHNQYLKAFGNTEELNEVKRLWFEMLQRFSPQAILRGAKAIIENSEYLPTLHAMIHSAERASEQSALPDAHSAYIEACRAPSPKANYNWSHPLVYHAGKRCDWYFLQTNPENIAYPLFKQHFNDLVQEQRAGAVFSAPTPEALPHAQALALDSKTNRQKLNQLRNNLKL